MARLRAIWDSINASYWFLPGLFAVLALALALFTVWLDRTGETRGLGTLIQVEIARPEGARSILTVIAGAMIGVASTVFSITIAAVAYASGSYGPRLLTNFMEDKGNQLSLATFIGTFVYSVVVLRTIRDAEEASVSGSVGDMLPGFVPQLSLLVAYALTAISVMVLVYFLNHVPASIRVNTVLESIGTRLIHDIRQVFAHKGGEAAPSGKPGGVPVGTDIIGYIQIIDHARLDTIAAREGARIVMAVRTGDFVHPPTALVFWDALGAPPVRDIRRCFALGGMRTPAQDLHFLIDELVEIGLRALSPGINDPFTAITALHWLGAATAELGQRDLMRGVGSAAPSDADRVVVLDDEFSHYVERGFGTMRPYVATNPSVVLVMFEVLATAASTLGDTERRQALAHEGDMLMRQTRLELDGPSLEAAEKRYRAFRQRMTDG
jgi:uncharacterized membrane protein